MSLRDKVLKNWNSKWKILIGVFIAFVFVGLLVYAQSLRNSNIEMKQEIERLSVELKNCVKTNSELMQEMKKQEEDYQKKINNLLRLANKPVRVIEIPKVIEKPVYITNEECQKMGAMIDEFIKIQKADSVK